MTERVRAILIFLALAVLHTWPLASAPHRLSLNHNADTQLNTWIVSWIAHTLPTHPSLFWQGNIFQPGENALMFSEPLVVPAIVGAPVLWLGGSPVLMFNLLLIAGLAATGFAGWWVVTRWTGSSRAIALLSGFAIAWLERRVRPAVVPWMVTLAVAGVTFENLMAPIHTAPFDGLPPVYSTLAKDPNAVLLVEFPFYPPDAVFQNGEYVLNATAHWRPVANGYSGVTPVSYRERSKTLWFFPDQRAVDTLLTLGATHAMVHLEHFGQDAPKIIRTLERQPRLRLVAADRTGHRLYRVVRE